MKKLAAVLFAFAFPFLSGCAVLETIENSPTASKLAVQQATLRVVGEDIEKAERAIFLVDDVRTMVMLDAVTIGLLDESIRFQIDWRSMSLADAQLLAMLLDELRDRLEVRIGQGVLNPEDKASINTVLDWIEDAAKMAYMYMQ